MASRHLTCWRTWGESEQCRPSPPGGTQGTGGPGRSGTAAAEVQLLGLTGGEVGVQTVVGHEEQGEERVTAGREDEPESRPGAEPAGWEGAGPLFDSGCWRDESGKKRGRGRDVGLERGEEAGPGGRGGEDGVAWRRRQELRPER